MPLMFVQTSVKKKARNNKRNELIDEKKNLPTNQLFWLIKIRLKVT